MKTRVLQEDGVYYPQRKGWLFWKPFYQWERDTIDMYDTGRRIVYFNNQPDAIKYAYTHKTKVVYKNYI